MPLTKFSSLSPGFEPELQPESREPATKWDRLGLPVALPLPRPIKSNKGKGQPCITVGRHGELLLLSISKTFDDPGREEVALKKMAASARGHGVKCESQIYAGISVLTSWPTDPAERDTRPCQYTMLQPGFEYKVFPVAAAKSQNQKVTLLQPIPQTLSLLQSRSTPKSVSLYSSPILLVTIAPRSGAPWPERGTLLLTSSGLGLAGLIRPRVH